MLLAYLASPIPPGYDFTYEFNITQHGSYWLHSHYMVRANEQHDQIHRPYNIM